MNSSYFTPLASNKSRAMIAGLLSNDPKTQERFLSQKDGIYKIICKVLFSSKTPEYIRAEYKERDSDDIVLSFIAELYEKGKFSREKLENLNAAYDASLYSYVKVCAIHQIQDKIRAYNSSINSRLVTDDERSKSNGEQDKSDKQKQSAFDKAISKIPAGDQSFRFEDRELLMHIIAAANGKLNEFQKFIVSRLLEDYDPEEILQEYGKKKNQQYSLNYYYAQKSLALSALKKVSARYASR